MNPMMVVADRAKSLFLTATELSDAERDHYLNKECAGDSELRRRVESLLRAHNSAPIEVLDPPRRAPGDGAAYASDLERDPQVRPGATLGEKYQLLEEIGAGGMGRVFSAQQLHPVRRQVAVKVLKGGLDSRAVLARFEAERQALALMDHPHIARVLDAGQTDLGRPYFVMELVRGTPMTHYCDEQRLTPRQRLELFLPVCQAIQHAHQKGVIHRDIKPSNVLVARYDERAVPKVIDFGVAKATGTSLADSTLITRVGSLVGTVEYMSPEQASLSQVDVDTRSDIYSLGVLLYELLTGATPHDVDQAERRALLDVLRVVREEEPVAPSVRLETCPRLAKVAASRGTSPARLVQQVRGELDWVLLKTLDKDRTRRYDTANALARDLERFLANELVEARPPSAVYRLRKFAQRHRTALWSAVGLATCLVIGAGASLWQAARAGQAERAALQAAVAEGEAKREAEQQRDAAVAAGAAAEQEAQRAAEERDRAEQLRAAALVEQAKAQRLLATNQLLLAKIALGNHDLPTALGWFAEAYRHAPEGSPLRASARNLIGAWRDGVEQTLVHDRGVHRLAVSPDGVTLMTAYFNSRTQIWDLATGLPRGGPQSHAGDVMSIQAFPDNRHALTSDWDGAHVWDLQRGERRYPMLAHDLREDTVLGALLSPDGRVVATRSPLDSLRLWDAETGRPRGAAQKISDEIQAFRFSADSRRVVAIGEHSARVFDATTGEPLGEPLTDVRDAAFHPDGQVIAVARNDGKLTLWDLKEGRSLAELPHEKPLVAVQFDTEGRQLLAHDEAAAHLWRDALLESRTRKTLPHTGYVFAARFSSARQCLLVASPMLVKAWSFDGERTLWERSSHGETFGASPERFQSVQFSPDGQTVALRTESQLIEARSAARGRLLFREPKVLQFAFSSDSRRFYAGGNDGLARVRSVDPASVRRITKAELPRDLARVETVAIHPNGQIAFVASDKVAQLFDSNTWAPLRDPLPLPGETDRAAFSPDGRLLVVATRTRPQNPGAKFPAPQPTGQLTFWEVSTGQRIGEPLEMARAAHALAFDRSGATLYVGHSLIDVARKMIRVIAQKPPREERAVVELVPGLDATLPDLWNADANGPTRVTVPDPAATRTFVSADGRRLLAMSVSGGARLYDAATGAPCGPEFQPDGTARERSPDGRYWLFGSVTVSPATLRIWDAVEGRACGEPLLNESAHVVARFSPDGDRLVTQWKFSAQLWDVATGLPLGAPLELPSNQIATLVFRPDGRRLYLTSGGLRIVDVPAAVADDPRRVSLETQVRTGLAADSSGSLQRLSHAVWLERQRELAALDKTSEQPKQQ